MPPVDIYTKTPERKKTVLFSFVSLLLLLP
jgi:hypothetical protein